MFSCLKKKKYFFLENNSPRRNASLTFNLSVRPSPSRTPLSALISAKLVKVTYTRLIVIQEYVGVGACALNTHNSASECDEFRTTEVTRRIYHLS